jgi:hypothetical protein
MRREILQQQMLLLVNQQVQEAANEDQLTGEKPTIDVAHTSLVHPKTDKWEKPSGLLVNERNMTEDMQQIFADFNKKDIFFEKPGSQPYIDTDGRIHLPRPDKVLDRVKELTLRTHYGNAAVQKGLRSSDKKFQLELDTQLFTDIENAIKERKLVEPPSSEKLARAEKLYLDAKQRLEAGESSYKAATHLLEAQKLLGWRVSTGCFSNKDRGGLTGSQLLNNMAVHAKRVSAADPKNSSKAKTLLKEADSLARDGYRALREGSCQIRFARWQGRKEQVTLKVWPGIKALISPASFRDIVSHGARFLQMRKKIPD